jgi:AraC-like DNA-binding protein
MSLRTVQRRFLRATGLTQASLYQIERARQATRLLKQGLSILDVVDLAGYADQPHLTRSLKRFIGLTPAQLIAQDRTEQLSFLFKTTPLLLDYADSVDQQKEYALEKNNRRGVLIPGWRDGSAAKLAFPLYQR